MPPPDVAAHLPGGSSGGRAAGGSYTPMSLLERLWPGPYLLKAAGLPAATMLSCQAVPTSPPFPGRCEALVVKQLTLSHSWDRAGTSEDPRGPAESKDAGCLPPHGDVAGASVLGLTFEAGSACVHVVLADVPGPACGRSPVSWTLPLSPSGKKGTRLCLPSPKDSTRPVLAVSEAAKDFSQMALLQGRWEQLGWRAAWVTWGAEETSPYTWPSLPLPIAKLNSWPVPAPRNQRDEVGSERRTCAWGLGMPVRAARVGGPRGHRAVCHIRFRALAPGQPGATTGQAQAHPGQLMTLPAEWPHPPTASSLVG